MTRRYCDYCGVLMEETECIGIGEHPDRLYLSKPTSKFGEPNKKDICWFCVKDMLIKEMND